MYVITGATGNTGSVIAHKLLDAKKKVRVVGRSKEKLQPFVARGAEMFIGDVHDAASLTRAFDSARAVYVMTPPDYSADLHEAQKKAGDAISTAILKAGVTHVVNLSSLGAHVPEGAGPISGLHLYEKKLDAIVKLNVLHLRPTYFFENFLSVIPAIKQYGALALDFRPDLRLPMIATRDIGARAADELLKLSFTGHSTRELLGPRDYTFTEVASILGKAIGNPALGYMQMPYQQIEQALMQMGMPQSTAQQLTEMTRALNEGRVTAQEKRSPENTTPTTLDQWAREVFAPAFLGKAASAQ
jgi:uncharacterized protein YbjT (DUF2867 family)